MNWINRLNEKINASKRGEYLRPSIPRRDFKTRSFRDNINVNPLTG